MNRKPQSTHAVIKRFTIGVFLSCSVAVSVNAKQESYIWETGVNLKILNINKDRQTRYYLECVTDGLSDSFADGRICKQGVPGHPGYEMNKNFTYVSFNQIHPNTGNNFSTYEFQILATVDGAQPDSKFKSYIKNKPACIQNKVNSLSSYCHAERAVFYSIPQKINVKDEEKFTHCLKSQDSEVLDEIGYGTTLVYARGETNSKPYNDNYDTIHACIN